MESIEHERVNELDNPLIIDVRSPSEYEEDHLPKAINLPVLDDEQRDRVGTLYHRESTFEARQVGARTITENLPGILREIEERADEDRPVVVYCWRGGMRSESLAVILERIGYPTYRVDGGYQSYRRTVHEYFEVGEWEAGPFVTLYSLTGCGKTNLLKRLNKQGYATVDLEGLAHHRGSAFGSIGRKDQPSQKSFENRLFQSIRRAEGPVFIEGESRHVGQIRVPSSLFEAMTSPPRIWLEADIDRRVSIIREEYQWPEAKPALIEQVDNLRERLGNARVDDLQQALRKDEVNQVIRELLEDYYDPAYRNSCPPKSDFDRILDANNPEETANEISDWAREQSFSTSA